jgi:carboxyl-terminal processing protease
LKKYIKKRFVFVLCLLLIVFSQSAFKTDFFEIAKQIEIYNSLFKEINMNYVDKTNPAELMESGVKKMLLDLDPYTVYSSEQDVENAKMRRSGDFVGIGASLRFIDDSLTVVELYKGYAADKGGLRPGDIINKINDISVGSSNDGVGVLLGGAKNSDVKITFSREGVGKTISLVRGDRKEKAVPIYRLLENNIGYIALTQFSRGSAKEVESALKFLLIDEAKGLILDLRNNPGGLLQEAVNIVNLFVPKNQLVVSTQSNIEKYNNRFVTKQQPLSADIPIVILVNERSASASEIVAGALQDLDRAVIMGKQSFGKGLVQQPKPLPYGAQVKITISRYFTPSGRCIQALDYRRKTKSGGVKNVEDNAAVFKTKNGRDVFGGGGIMPDVNLGTSSSLNLIRVLEKDHFIFNFAVEYCKKHPVENLKNFNLKTPAFNQFKKYCFDKGFSLETNTEEFLSKAYAAAKEDGLNTILESVVVFNSALNKEKEKEFILLKDEILRLLSEEVIKIAFYKEGVFEYALLNDNAIKEAKELLSDLGRYASFLK